MLMPCYLNLALISMIKNNTVVKKKQTTAVFTIDIIYMLFFNHLTVVDYFKRLVCSRLRFDMGGG